MTYHLTYCSVCSEQFTNRDFPLPPKPLVFTPCFHIFHQTCLGGWVTTAERDCPTCRAPIYKHQAGKTYAVYWQIFLIALQRDPDIVLQTLQDSQHVNSTCAAACHEDLPLTLLRFDAAKKQLVHSRCSSHEMLDLLMQDIANVVRKIVPKHPKLQKNFTPTPPTFYQRMLTDYPIHSRTLVIGSVSVAALVLNRHRYNGGNQPLFALGLPAHITLSIAQYLGFLTPPQP